MVSDELASALRRPVSGRSPSRIGGIDIARAVAIVGMVMVHIGPVRQEGFGWVGEAYRVPHGRAAILFIVVAGIGVSLLARSATGERSRGVLSRLLWRALLLLPLGLALQELDTGVAVILQYYALFFLIALVATRIHDRALVWGTAMFALLGPVAILIARSAQPGWFAPAIPEWHEPAQIARDLVLTGIYPASVWTAPLLAGIWIGRQDLRSLGMSVRMAVGGAVLAGGSFAVSWLLGGIVASPDGKADWRQLAAIEPHNEMPLWVLQATGIGIAIVGACLLVAQALPRLSWPAVAMGQLALTVYVAHLLVLSWQPDWLVRSTFASAWASVARFLVIALVLMAAWRTLIGSGPLETVFRAPWWLARALRRPTSRRPPPGPAQTPGSAAGGSPDPDELATAGVPLKG